MQLRVNAVGFVDGARPSGIFTTVEYPTLLANPNITNVITGKPVRMRIYAMVSP